MAEAQAALVLWDLERALPPEIGQLLRHLALLPAETAVRGLVEAADLDGPVAVDETTARDALQRYVWLLNRVGDWLPLTAAGWLPPAVVTDAMDALWPWIGKRNREDLTEPVRRLRASAQRLGLLRVIRGRLLVTKAGAALRDDPVRMWQHVAERLVGKPKDRFTRTAAALLLLAAAAGRVDDEQLAAVLTAAGWSGRGRHRRAPVRGTRRRRPRRRGARRGGRLRGARVGDRHRPRAGARCPEVPLTRRTPCP